MNTGILATTIRRHPFSFFGLAVLWCLAAVWSARADTNLLTNPGFETGNFSGWSAAGPFLGLQAGHTGSFSAYCGSGYNDNGTVGDLFSQTVTTTPGLNYEVSLWVIGNGGAGPDEVYVLWDGSRILSLANQTYGAWTQLEVTVMATSASSTVGFGFRNQPANYDFDDAVVTPNVIVQTPEPSTVTIGALGLAGFVAYRRRR
jgi:hypothetical protein